ncbi:hypothetical protein BSKO_05641 [Bryopsis sp. KO-2023]|nr:hypothetical protein BSKO_05641 [Bryopsis sp. KO-2023]
MPKEGRGKEGWEKVLESYRKSRVWKVGSGVKKTPDWVLDKKKRYRSRVLEPAPVQTCAPRPRRTPPTQAFGAQPSKGNDRGGWPTKGRGVGSGHDEGGSTGVLSGRVDEKAEQRRAQILRAGVILEQGDPEKDGGGLPQPPPPVCADVVPGPPAIFHEKRVRVGAEKPLAVVCECGKEFTSKGWYRNVRTIVDLEDEVLFFTEYLGCSCGATKLAWDPSIMDQLPVNIRAKFDFVFTHKKACTRAVVWECATSGASIASVTRGIEERHHRKWLANAGLYLGDCKAWGRSRSARTGARDQAGVAIGRRGGPQNRRHPENRQEAPERGGPVVGVGAERARADPLDGPHGW